MHEEEMLDEAAWKGSEAKWSLKMQEEHKVLTTEEINAKNMSVGNAAAAGSVIDSVTMKSGKMP